MNGVDKSIANLEELLREMQPTVRERDLVFISLKGSKCPVNDIPFLLCFKEDEGVTFIMSKHDADRHGFYYRGLWARIILEVHSSLEAVGFLARITEVLAKNKISTNVVSAYHHDHLFVRSEYVETALDILHSLSKNSHLT